MRKEKIILLILLIIGIILRLVNLDQSFWLDEAAQAFESARPLSEQLKMSADFHPPLFHLILHFWMRVSHSEVWIRLLSVFYGVGSIIIIYLLTKLITNKYLTFLTVLLLVVNPYHLWYSQEARPYMQFIFFSLLSTYSLLRKNNLSYFLSTTLSLFTSYFSFFLIFGQVLTILVFEKNYFRQLIRNLCISFLLYIPWLPFFFRQLEVGMNGLFTGWTNVVSVSALKLLPLTFAKFILGKGQIDNVFFTGLILLPALILFFRGVYLSLYDKKKKEIVMYFSSIMIISFLLAFIIPVVAPQRLIFLLPLFLLILVSGIERLPKILQITFITILLLLNLNGIKNYYQNPYIQREQWRQAITYVESESSFYKINNQSTALFIFPTPFAPYLWYNKNKIEAYGIASEFNIKEKDLQNLYPIISTKQRIYLFQYLTGLTDPTGKTAKFLAQNGFYNKDTVDFPGVGFIYIYDKK